ncbi:MAG: hypothetical protein HQK52_22215 [Oligoflexia bacterium]|nr:hypothetical protein [Oligoflexia bacterium]
MTVQKIPKEALIVAKYVELERPVVMAALVVEKCATNRKDVLAIEVLTLSNRAISMLKKILKISLVVISFIFFSIAGFIHYAIWIDTKVPLKTISFSQTNVFFSENSKIKMPFKMDAFVILSGAWDNDDGSLLENPLQYSNVKCSIKERSCTEHRARIYYNSLVLEDEDYVITKYDKDIIVYESIPERMPAPACAKYIYTAHSQTNTAYGVRKKISEAEHCRDVDDELKIRLTDGKRIIHQLKEDAAFGAKMYLTFFIILISIFSIYFILKIFRSKQPPLET